MESSISQKIGLSKVYPDPQKAIFSYDGGLGLTEHDLKAIGAVITQWAYAEHMMVNYVKTLQKHPNSASKRSMEGKARRNGFSFWYKEWKRLYPLIFVGHPLHLSANQFLVSRGDELGTERDKVAHWLANRYESVDAINFFNSDQDWHSEEIKPSGDIYLETNNLIKLAININRWRADLRRLYYSVYQDTLPHPLYSPPNYGYLVRDLYSHHTNEQIQSVMTVEAPRELERL